MDQTRFSTIVHADHRFRGPLSNAKADEPMDALDLFRTRAEDDAW